jgi:hypothetical protein
MAQTKKNRFWITLLIILIVLAIFSIPLLSLIGNYLIVKDSLRKADLITSVSGPAYRAIYAADLCQSGLAPRLFYTGGFNENDQRYEAKWSEYLATLEGVPPEEIFIDDSTVNSTYQEAVRVKEYIDYCCDRRLSYPPRPLGLSKSTGQSNKNLDGAGTLRQSRLFTKMVGKFRIQTDGAGGVLQADLLSIPLPAHQRAASKMVSPLRQVLIS